MKFDIDEDEFTQWREQPVTKVVTAYLDEMAERIKAHWMGHLAKTTAPHELAVLQAELKAKLEFITDFKALKIEDITHDEDSHQRSRARTA